MTLPWKETQVLYKRIHKKLISTNEPIYKRFYIFCILENLIALKVSWWQAYEFFYHLRKIDNLDFIRHDYNDNDLHALYWDIRGTIT